MFDLDTAIKHWSESKAASRCRRERGAEELADHVHCEVERLSAAGMDVEQAFEVATRGLAEGLGSDRDRALHKAIVANALVWAALILASALIMARSGESESFGLLIPIVFIPLWFASDRILRKLRRHSD